MLTTNWTGWAKGRPIWTPAEQTGLIEIYDPNVAADVNAGTPANNDLVTTLKGRVGGATTQLSRFTGGYEPTWKTNVRDGNAALLYAGATQSMRTATDILPTQGQHGILIVCEGVSIGASATVVTFSNDANGYVSFLANTNTPSSRIQNGVLVTNGSDKNLGAAWLNNTPHVLLQNNDGTHAGHTVYQDWAAVSSTNGVNVADPGTTTRQHRLILGSTAGIVNPFAGYFYYIAILDHPFSAIERALWKSWLKYRFPSIA